MCDLSGVLHMHITDSLIPDSQQMLELSGTVLHFESSELLRTLRMVVTFGPDRELSQASA